MSKLISDSYRAENAYQHAQNNHYGVNGHIHLNTVLGIAERAKCLTAIDYGCGQGSLAAHAKRLSPMVWQCYDPAVERFSALPTPADMLVCTDVLEHVEPDK